MSGEPLADGAPRRGGSLRGAGPMRRGDALADLGFTEVPTTQDGGADTMRPGALRGAARGRNLDGLAHTLFLRLSPVIAAVVLATQVVIAWVNYGDQIRIEGGRAQMMADMTARALARPGWTGDHASQLQALALDPAFRFALLRDAAGGVVGRLGEEPRGRSFERIQVSAEVEPGPAAQPAGSLTLVLSAEGLRANAEKQIVMVLGASLALILAFALSLRLAVGRHVLAPLRRLLAAMGEVEHKRWVTVDLAGRRRPSREIADISAAFNRMVEGLKSGDEARHLLAELERTHARLAEANGLVMESLGYARRIQQAVLPGPAALSGAGLEVAVLWEPLHVVGGDYYWIEEIDGLGIVVVADCTGHGVPGAFLTLIVATALDRILHDQGLRRPDAILAALDGVVRARLRQELQQETSVPDGSDDGLDCGICVVDRANGVVHFAGAGLALTVLADGGTTRIKGRRHGLGYRRTGREEPIAAVEIPLRGSPTFFLMTDGVSDQMGGASRRLLGHRGVAEILGRHQDMPLPSQVAALEAALAVHRGAEPRRDDMALVAFRPGVE
ncbi:Serine phosphatase RsbU, regulator of sigma subunit [Methylobacterium sp. 174MFSha1.1]|uniref:SpoIIE family protein phosphatase n=1 Tax=Methylobacterium sp. 174MFSha1.1 TaxID=1502749 RepID=UPI0008E6726B|nr:SpoIIE family protein phosphatase [Methylobacterium sp. 174MFSha1.1]SFU87531.1 Serine phosphatase RsbU, regulator of sigma subunit [Methylobacterium sp. 174MFSha1.1]